VGLTAAVREMRVRYDRGYFDRVRESAEASARVIVPMVVDLIGPASVLDVGCGDGTWLDAYRRAGVGDYFGVDGGDVAGVLRVPPDRFASHDLTAPLDLGGRFDLVQCLEVAQNLPVGAAEGLVRSLVRHGDAVLFSAAIPHQGGAGHMNEQWPDYWAQLFRRAGFGVYDWARPRVWADDRVAWWYAQNAVLFVRDGTRAEWVGRLPPPASVGPLLRLVHPKRYLAAVAPPAGPRPDPARSVVNPAARPERPYDVAVVIQTIGRPTLERAVRSVFAQDFRGTVQILIGIDVWAGSVPRAALDVLVTAAPAHCTVTVFDPGYSTSARHGGVHPERCGGALRTLLSYAANSRRVTYLDDDNWWAPDHLSTMTAALAGRAWAYALRWYVDPETAAPLCEDRWESIGPDAGCFRDRFGGWVDPNCLILDKIACEPALRLWSVPLPGDGTRMTGDRSVFADLLGRGPAGATGRATVYYALTPTDGMHAQRLKWIAEAVSRPPRSGSTPAGGLTSDGSA